MERIKAHIPWDERRIVALLIISPPARSPCRHNSSLAAPPVTKIIKPTERERKKQAERQAGTTECPAWQPRLWAAAVKEPLLERAGMGARETEPLSRAGAQGRAERSDPLALCFLKPKVESLMGSGLERSPQREAKISGQDAGREEVAKTPWRGHW